MNKDGVVLCEMCCLKMSENCGVHGRRSA
uniref:Uncharacterized protein n=1 Tax=Anguilla anguilla TaxID=7936 RepID=A0A0E9UVM3_ANGAN